MSWLHEEEFKGLSDNFFDDFIDFPLEDIDTTNGEGGDWNAKFKELEPPPMDMFTSFPSEFNSCGISSKAGVIHKTVSVLPDASAALSGVNNTLHQSPPSHHDVKVSKLFQSSSPVSVLEGSDGSFSPQNSTSQRFTFPVKGLRSKRKRPTALRLRYLYPFEPEKLTPGESESESYYSYEQHAKKKRKIFTTNHTVSTNSEEINGIVRKCSHCETTKTPQWREGPNGPKTLCNACGVRFRSGRLVPEYRPASSPTFIPSVHSNSHKKIIEMRTREGDQFDHQHGFPEHKDRRAW